MLKKSEGITRVVCSWALLEVGVRDHAIKLLGVGRLYDLADALKRKVGPLRLLSLAIIASQLSICARHRDHAVTRRYDCRSIAKYVVRVGHCSERSMELLYRLSRESPVCVSSVQLPH